MVEVSEERLGLVFGLTGGLLLIVGAFLALAGGIVDVVAGHLPGAVTAWSETALLLLVGGLALFFSYLGRHAWHSRPVSTGILLVVTAVLGWATLSLGANLAALIGAVLLFLAGVLVLIPPLARRFESPAQPSSGGG